jgi:hypothetical protein
VYYSEHQEKDRLTELENKLLRRIFGPNRKGIRLQQEEDGERHLARASLFELLYGEGSGGQDMKHACGNKNT